MDGLRSVVDATVPDKYLRMVKARILDEVEQRFEGNIQTIGEDRFVGKEGGILMGRYLMEEKKEESLKLACEHGPFIAGEYEVHQCMDCGKLFVYKIIERVGPTKKLKFIGTLDSKNEES